MAKNFKNKVLASIVKVFVGILGQIAVVLCAALCLIALLTSPLWMPFYAIRDAEGCAINLFSKPDESQGEEMENLGRCGRYCIYIIYALMVVLRWIYLPFINLFPMKYRKEYILRAGKPLSKYSVKTQVAYYLSCNDEKKRELLRSVDFSEQAKATVWQMPNEKANFIALGEKLSVDCLADLLGEGCNALLKQYFHSYTPDKEVRNMLLRYANAGNASAIQLLLNLIKQQRPDKDFLGHLLNIKNERFKENLTEVIDRYADLDAVNFCTQDTGVEDPEEQQNIVAERWTNFCKNKHDISVAAQKEMGYAQYLVFAETGHSLKYSALQHLCLHVSNPEYLKAVIENEFENIQASLQTALKSEYWRYSVYLAVKEAGKKPAA
ncbi:MAG: hypothetical protein IJ770_05470 [Alphaproteobacteria bacterium]|nr:hypothetical protein [Alphaproteobacteria bacterium]